MPSEITIDTIDLVTGLLREIIRCEREGPTADKSIFMLACSAVSVLNSSREDAQKNATVINVDGEPFVKAYAEPRGMEGYKPAIIINEDVWVNMAHVGVSKDEAIRLAKEAIDGIVSYIFAL